MFQTGIAKSFESATVIITPITEPSKRIRVSLVFNLLASFLFRADLMKPFRNKIYLDNSEGNKTVEDLQNRIRSNIDSIQLLNHQVNLLQRENVLQKEALEKEMALRQTLQLQLESKNQFIHSITGASPSVLRKASKSKGHVS